MAKSLYFVCFYTCLKNKIVYECFEYGCSTTVLNSYIQHVDSSYFFLCADSVVREYLIPNGCQYYFMYSLFSTERESKCKIISSNCFFLFVKNISKGTICP